MPWVHEKRLASLASPWCRSSVPAVVYHKGTNSKAVADDPIMRFCEISGPRVLVAQNHTCEAMLLRRLRQHSCDVVRVIDTVITPLDVMVTHVRLLAEGGGQHYLLFRHTTVADAVKRGSSSFGAADIAGVCAYAQAHAGCRVEVLCRYLRNCL